MTTEERPLGAAGVRAWYDRHRGPATIVVGWLITRALMIAVLVLLESFVVGDVYYYHRKIVGAVRRRADRRR